jgi:hypothetical protein
MYYLFLDEILPRVVHMNQLLQTEKVVITDVHNKMCNSY